MMQGSSSDRNRALNIIYLVNKNSVCGFILKNSGSFEEAKDVFQEAVIALYENVRDRKFKGESTIGTYLYSIARFKWLNQLKKNSVRNKHYDTLETERFTESPLATLMDREKSNSVMEILEELGASCKKLLVDTLYHNVSMKEIVLQGDYSSEQIVRNKKYKCLQKLKNLIIQKPGLIQILKAND